MEYLEKPGLVTEECFPYTSGAGEAPDCPKQKCTGTGKWKEYKCQHSSTVINDEVDAIKSDIYENGPVETGFEVFDDFMQYKSGVYRYTTGNLLGGHAVKIIGWGQDSGIDYWICANSWGTTWGEKGFFKIYVDQCGISDMVVSCLPKVRAAE